MAKQKERDKKAGGQKRVRKPEGPYAEAAARSAQAEQVVVKVPSVDKADVQKAIKEGLALIKDGKSKADAAWAIYGKIKNEEKDLIVAAFVHGAALTEKGALTYWYNCRRKESKEAKKTSS